MAESTDNQRAIQVDDVVKLTKPDLTVEYYVITNIITTSYPINIHISEMLHPVNIKHILITESGQQTIMSPDQTKDFTVDYQVTYINEGQLSSKDILLSGVPDIDIQILVQMDDVALIRLCQLDQYTRSLCNNPKLWYQKIHKRFKNILVNPDVSLKENYINLTKYPEDNTGLAQAANDGNLSLIQWLIATHPSIITPNLMTLNSAAEGGHLDIIEWLMDTYKIKPDGTTVTHAIEQGQINILDWLHQLKLVDAAKSNKYMMIAIKFDQADVLKWLQSHEFITYVTGDYLQISNEMIDEAMNSSSIKVLELWKDQLLMILEHMNGNNIRRGYRKTLSTPRALTLVYMNMAIRKGQVKFVKFLMSLDSSITPAVGSVSAATSNCQLDMVKYLQGLPKLQQPSLDSIKNAIYNNCSEVIEYYIETNPTILDSQKLQHPFLLAAQHGHTDMVKLGLKLNPPIYPNMAKILAGSDHTSNILGVLQFAASLNPPLYPNGPQLQKVVDDKIGRRFWSVDIIKFLAHMPSHQEDMTISIRDRYLSHPIFPSEDTINLVISNKHIPLNIEILEYIASDPVIPAGLRMIAANGLKS